MDKLIQLIPNIYNKNISLLRDALNKLYGDELSEELASLDDKEIYQVYRYTLNDNNISIDDLQKDELPDDKSFLEQLANAIDDAAIIKRYTERRAQANINGILARMISDDSDILNKLQNITNVEENTLDA